MSRFLSAMAYSATTWNGAASLSTPDSSGEYSGRLALFFKSVRGLNNSTLYKYLVESSQESVIDTFLMTFHIRDCRGGKAERDLGRSAMVWLFLNYPDEFEKVMPLMAEYGRWDDIMCLFPNVLKLNDIDVVRRTYGSPNITDDMLGTLRELQRVAVQIMKNKLIEDHKLMLQGKPVSLAAKWCVSERDSLDRQNDCKVYSAMCDVMKISPRTLRKTYLTPLRSYIGVVETYMCSRRWDEISFSKVPSCAMRRLKKAFEKHSPELFGAYTTALASGDPSVKVNAKQLLPGELVRELRINNGQFDQITESQWQVLVDKAKSMGSLKKSVVIVDTSASMHTPNYVPFDNAVALGMLISSIAEGEWRDIVFTFNTYPTVVKLRPDTFAERWRQVMSIPWGGSTDLQATFKLILERGQAANLSPDDYPEELWLLTDMQFNAVNGYDYESKTNFQAIEDMYLSAGIKRPRIIFWNLNGSSTDFPVSVDDFGTALISGFSPDIMKAVLSGKEFSPVGIMQSTLNDKRYDMIRNALTL